jgi:hypothetical protein
MKTEVAQSLRPEDSHELSTALTCAAPKRIRVVDSRSRPVPLTYAGFVVQPGKCYEIQARLEPDHGTIIGGRIIDTATHQRFKHHQIRRIGIDDWLCFQMPIHRERIWLRSLTGLLFYHQVRAKTVETEWEDSGVPGVRISARVPFIVRRPLIDARLAVWFAAWFVVGVLVEAACHSVREGSWQEIIAACRSRNFTQVLSLVNIRWLCLWALSWPVVRILWSMWDVVRRARELAAEFRAKLATAPM